MNSNASEELADIWLAPRRTEGQWTIRDYQGIDFTTERGWQRAIELFEDRINHRFLAIIDKIKDERFAGFAVMALDCLLVETLEQFRQGKADSEGESKTRFCAFLTETPAFEPHFTNKAGKGSLAWLFYDQIRCGILHQAETKLNSRIVTRSDEPLVRRTGDNRGLVVNRRKFHEQLVQAYEMYLQDLRNFDPAYGDLRTKFKAKMDAIARKPEWGIGIP